MSQRQERFGKLIQAEVAGLLREIKDPRVADAGLITITSVMVTADLGMARIAVALHGATAKQGEALIEGLSRASGYVRSELRKRLDSKKTPELRFELDKGTDAANRVEEILKGLKP